MAQCWYKRTHKWVCQIKIDGKRKHIGYFTDERDAAAAYQKALIKHLKNKYAAQKDDDVQRNASEGSADTDDE
jgi:hypothetical protein